MRSPGLDHIILTVADVARSRTFYADILGFTTTMFGEEPNRGFFFPIGDGQIIVLPSRQPIAADRFSEFRIGLDHLAFTAPSKAALDELAATLLAAGVDTKGVEQFAQSGNWYVAFRDPDNIQLEYWLP
jgi:glyoxylase I family protein